MDTEAGSVAGTHRPAKPMRTWLWGSVGLLFLLLCVRKLGQGQDVVLALSYGAFGVAYIWLGWASTRAHTLVDEDGIRVSQGIGGRRIDWDAITAVSKPDEWDPQPTLTVTTDAGKGVLTHVPKPLREDFIQYANAYRSSELPALD